MNPIPFYPADLEAHWLAAAQRETRASSDRDALLRLLPDIRRLADRFTTARPAPEATLPAAPGASEATPPSPSPSNMGPACGRSAGHPSPSPAPYLRTTRLALAYSLYFAPLAHARMAYLLPELPPVPPRTSPSAPYRILDLGAGTGGASLAALRHASASGHAALTLDAVDISRPALRCLHDAFTALRPAAFPGALLRTACADLLSFDAPPAAFDLVLLHYVLNELSPARRLEALSRAARALAPGGFLLVCEPLLHAEGDWMRALRAAALSDLGLHVHAPCPHAAPCPLPPDTPCHAVRTFPLPRTLQILNTPLRRDLRHLAYTWLLLSKLPPPATPYVRLTALPRPSNGQTLCPACCPDGSSTPVQILHRTLSGTARKRLRHLERGARLPVATLTPVGTPPTLRATLP